MVPTAVQRTPATPTTGTVDVVEPTGGGGVVEAAAGVGVDAGGADAGGGADVVGKAPLPVVGPTRQEMPLRTPRPGGVTAADHVVPRQWSRQPCRRRGQGRWRYGP